MFPFFFILTIDVLRCIDVNHKTLGYNSLNFNNDNIIRAKYAFLDKNNRVPHRNIPPGSFTSIRTSKLDTIFNSSTFQFEHINISIMTWISKKLSQCFTQIFSIQTLFLLFKIPQTFKDKILIFPHYSHRFHLLVFVSRFCTLPYRNPKLKNYNKLNIF